MKALCLALCAAFGLAAESQACPVAVASCGVVQQQVAVQAVVPVTPFVVQTTQATLVPLGTHAVAVQAVACPVAVVQKAAVVVQKVRVRQRVVVQRVRIRSRGW